MKSFLYKINKKHLFFLGLLMILFSQIPMLLLGTDAIIPYHDQLDGELIAYIYQAKYLFSGLDIIPEFLNGAAKTSLTPPAPLAVLLFRFLSPLAAYMTLQILGQIVAYTGMFALLLVLTKNNFAALLTALLYAFLPFLPVYGLSQYGAPLLLLCFINLYTKKFRLVSYIYIALYAAMSSLVLCGFLWILFLGIFSFILLSTHRLKSHPDIPGALFMLLTVYAAENLSLFKQLLGGGEESFISHKSEYVLNGNPFFTSFWNYLKNNDGHSTDYHFYILVLALVLICILTFFRKRLSAENINRFKLLAADICLICILCVIAAFWQSYTGIAFREKMGTLGSFQLDRILWSAPMLWYIALAFCLTILWSCKSFLKWFSCGISGLLLLLLSLSCLKGSFVKPCLQELLLPNYETISWSDYLAYGVMDQVEEYLGTQEGLQKNEYKVASLGIDPAAALYHGFYCVDGYSNNYDIEYKHAFRKVIAPELARNEWLADYYDDWGNRCYLFSSEIPGYYNIQKGSFWYNDLQLDTSALHELGCDYILSAAYIVNAEELQLELLQEDAFETESSYYRIYIYRLNM